MELNRQVNVRRVCVFDGMGDRSNIKQDFKRINIGLCDMWVLENEELLISWFMLS
jgi:hypothetical protein